MNGSVSVLALICKVCRLASNIIIRIVSIITILRAATLRYIVFCYILSKPDFRLSVK